MTWTVAASISITIGVLILLPSARSKMVTRLGLGRAEGSAMHRRSLVAASAVILVGAALTLASSPHTLILLVTGVGVAACAYRLRRLRHLARDRERTRDETVEAIDALLAELTAGIPSTLALTHVAHDWRMLAPSASAARLGGDVPAALRHAAARPGAAALDHFAAAWEVSERSGASQTAILERLGDVLLEERDTRREVMALLGPTRATARLLALLPLLGVALGSGMGSSPLHVLTGTLIGAVCLAAGSSLACAGLLWVEHIASRAEAA